MARAKALLRFDETADAIRPIDALGGLNDLQRTPPYPTTADDVYDAVSGLGRPSAIFTCDQTSGNLPSTIGAATLTPGGTPLYGLRGIAGGVDRAVGFDSTTDRFNGLTTDFNVDATSDLFAAWGAQHSALPPTVEMMLVKGNSGATRWTLYLQSGVLRFEATSVSGTKVAVLTVPSTFIGKGHVGIAGIDRGAGNLRIGVRTLDGIEVLSASTALFAGETLSNADAFEFGNRASALPSLSQTFSWLALGATVGCAAGLTANISTALASLAARVNAALPAVVDAAAGRGRSFVAVNGTAFEAADQVAGSTLATRNSSVQAFVKWDLADQAKLVAWDLAGYPGAWTNYARSNESYDGDLVLEMTLAVTGGEAMLGFRRAIDATTTPGHAGFTHQAYTNQSAANQINFWEVNALTYSGGASSYAAGDKIRVQRTAAGVFSLWKQPAAGGSWTLLFTGGTDAASMVITASTVGSLSAAQFANVKLTVNGVRTAISWQHLVDVQATPSSYIGTVYARGKGTGAADYLSAALELRVVNAAGLVGELGTSWATVAGVLKRQVGAQFQVPTSGYMMVTVTRRWVSATSVVIRYFVGGTMITEVTSTDGDIGGGTTGTTTIGARHDGTRYLDFFDGVIDELRVLDYELTPEEVAATWDRITKYQPLGYELVKQLHPPGFPISDNPTSRVQRETNLIGQALGYASAQAENMRANILPDRAYGNVLERWEDIVSEPAKPLDSVDTRRARVISHLRRHAGVSIPGVQESLEELVATNPTNLEILAFGPEFIRGYGRDTVWSRGAGWTITKTGGVNGAWDAGASTTQSISGDGIASIICGTPAASTQRMFGLTNITPTHSFDIKWALYLGRTSSNSLDVYQSGSSVFATTYAAGDALWVRRIGTTITYWQNGVLLYTSLVTASGALVADTSFLNSSTVLQDLRLYDIVDGAWIEVGVDWSGATNVTITTEPFVPYDEARMVKFAGVNGTYDAAAFSVESIAGDGYVEARAAETNLNRMIGLGVVNTSEDFADVDYGIILNSAATLDVRENGGASLATTAYVAGDIVRVERVGTTILYKKNGVTFYTSLVPSTGALHIDTAMAGSLSTLVGVRLYVAGVRSSITWQDAANVAAVSNPLRAQVASGTDLQFAAASNLWRVAATSLSHAPFIKTTTGEPAEGWGARILTQISPVALPDRVEAGVAFYDFARHHYFLFGYRNNAGTYQLITERFIAGVSQGVTVRTVTTLRQLWLQLSCDAPVPAANATIDPAAWTLTGRFMTSPTSTLLTFAAMPASARFQWAGLYVRTFGGTASAAADVYFDDTRIVTPYGDRSLRFYAYRNPALAGSPDVVGAQNVIRALKQAHTEADFITSKALLYDTDGHAYDRGPAGGY